MTAIRIDIATPEELFEAPVYDPLNGRLEKRSGIDRILAAIDDARISSTAGGTVEIVMSGGADEGRIRAAIATYCETEAEDARRSLSLTRRRGRQALWIAVPVLAIFLALSTMAANALGTAGLGNLISNSLVIAGWVALWRPAELLLYEWWPYRHRVRLLTVLSRMTVRVVAR